LLQRERRPSGDVTPLTPAPPPSRQIFNLRFTAKQLVRTSKKCEKEEREERSKVKRAIEKGNIDGARLYAQNAIRKKNETLNYLKARAAPPPPPPAAPPPPSSGGAHLSRVAPLLTHPRPRSWARAWTRSCPGWRRRRR